VIVYTNGNFHTSVATLDLYGWALDGEITLADLQQAVAGSGIKANNNYGLTVYGPYTPSEWISYKNNNYYKRTTEKVKISTTEPTVLYTMVHNVKITKGVTDPYGAIADKTNPKTGDMIYAPMMVLGLSASALAVLFYLNKKRAF
jgi:LPXTG-motif cell wall-anchored protein